MSSSWLGSYPPACVAGVVTVVTCTFPGFGTFCRLVGTGKGLNEWLLCPGMGGAEGGGGTAKGLKQWLLFGIGGAEGTAGAEAVCLPANVVTAGGVIKCLPAFDATNFFHDAAA